ncbi:hypothetical protein MPNT_80086 [Candidatus Methylacidithermus pantelleriae]|uniref:Uncharacterized protein n=1 Tax=Candidatus Methylacidithermus pantelleriae TaxID=2744239 RepID=A0A8J2FTX3_9BACT|nr:hypothetical protein MPNT_80086 [Candidatus Methylacidithermus pantelleriae]
MTPPPESFMCSGSKLEGKIAWRSKRRSPSSLRKLRGGFQGLEKVICKLEQKKPRSNVLHGKKGRLAILRTRVDALLAHQKSRRGASLFAFAPPLSVKEFSLEENDYAHHAAWKNDWHAEWKS